MRKNALTQNLQAAGHRLTAPREIILAVIFQSSEHLSADEILKRARRADPHLNKSVVYRNLELLTALDLISYTNLGNGRGEYEQHRHPHHHHLVCRQCNQTVEVVAVVFERLEKELQARYGFSAHLDHFAIFGICRKCRKDDRGVMGEDRKRHMRK